MFVDRLKKCGKLRKTLELRDHTPLPFFLRHQLMSLVNENCIKYVSKKLPQKSVQKMEEEVKLFMLQSSVRPKFGFGIS